MVDKYWDSFAIGAALCGIPLVIGENVGGGDNNTILIRTAAYALFRIWIDALPYISGTMTDRAC